MSERLSHCISPPQPSDSDSLVRLFTDKEVRKHLGGPLCLSDAEARVEALTVPNPDGHIWAIREGTLAIGLIWLTGHHEPPDVELSFALLPEWQGQGHAYQAASLALRFAFESLSLPRVVSETQSANIRAIALLTRLGMSLERRLWRCGAEQSLFALHGLVHDKAPAAIQRG